MIRGLHSLRAVLGRVGRDARGSMAVETAIVIPTLLLMSLGGFQVSKMVARQVELQNAVSEAAQIAQATTPDTAAKRTTIRDIIKTSTGITDNAKVQVTNEYRCDTSAVQASSTCSTGQTLTTYLKIVVVDTFNPIWTDYGAGTSFDYSVTRRIIVA